MKFKKGDLFYHKFRKIIGEVIAINIYGDGCGFCKFNDECEKCDFEKTNTPVINRYKSCACRHLTDRERFLYYTHGSEECANVIAKEGKEDV